MPTLEQIDPRKIWKNWVMALLSIFALITLSEFAAVFAGGGAERLAHDINLSGRQGMLSQRILYFATAYDRSGYTGVRFRRELEASVAEMEEAHRLLTSRLSSADLRSYYKGPAPNLDDEVARYLTNARQVLGAEPEQRATALSTMQATGPGVLLERLDQAVGLHEARAAGLTARVERVALVDYLLAVAALALSAAFIFRPSHQTIVTAFSELEAVNLTLEDREFEAFSALEEAEDAWAEAEAARLATEAGHEAAKAQIANAGYELQAPIAALRRSIDAARSQVTGPGDRVLFTAARLAGILDRLSARLLSAETDGAADDPAVGDGAGAVREPVDLVALSQAAVGTVSTAAGPQAPGLRFPAPDGAAVTVLADPIALYRCLLHLLRDAQDQPGSSGIDLRLDIEHHETSCTAAFTIEQNVDESQLSQARRNGIVDRRLSDHDPRAAALEPLVAQMGAAAQVTWKAGQRRVDLVFSAELHRPQSVRRHPPSSGAARAAGR